MKTIANCYRRWATGLKALLAVALVLGSVSVFAQAASKNFDHIKTGFALTGLHANARCESCHIGGVFKGTPRDCASCHVSGTRLSRANVNKPSTHFPTQLGCDSCHTTVSYTGASFNHAGIAPNGCASCHNGTTTSGKPSGHIPTQAACSTCHKTSAWLPATSMDHSGFTAATNCASCHNGTNATGKTSSHISTALNCTSCHSTTGWKPTTWNHGQQAVTNQCSTCHSGANPPADGPTANHIPYKTLSGVNITNCDSCHKGGYSSWNPGQFHKNVSVSTQCASCHMTTSYGATGRPSTSMHSGQTVCESCHKTTSSWASSKPDHSLFNGSTNCSTCHNGTSATGKSGTHISTTLNCTSCHSTSVWKPTTWNHTQQTVTNQCSTCHSGANPPADGPTANHIPYKTLSGVSITNCDSCHKGGYASWNPGRFHQNVTVSSQCASCHMTTSYGATGRPGTAIHSGQTVCETCHKSTSTWFGAKPDHGLFTSATNCTTCHNGSAATGKTGSHIPTTVNCVSCHSTTAWKPTKWNHSQMPVVNQCSTCHSGAYPPADGKTANHIPYVSLTGVVITNCDSCHKGGYSSWNPGQFHTNVSLSTQCASCHMTTSYGATGRPATAIHSGQNVCETCHKSTSTWTGGKPDHSLYTSATNCTTCHNGSAATGKTGSHIPTTVNCVSCHSTTAWKPTKWNHSQMPVVNQCSTCHSGAYPPADGKTANHIPYVSLTGVVITNCDSCHKGGYSSWFPGSFHNNVSITTQCATCHLSAAYGLTAKPGTQTHASVTGNCESCHKSTISWASVQFTHAPANAVGTGTCDTCHNGSTSAVSKPSNHIPIPAGVAKCDSCHKSQVSFASSITMNHTAVTTGTCKSCHNGSYLSAGTQGALAKPGNHIPEAQLLNGASLDCNACHTSTTSWLSETMNHNSSQGNGAGWCKSCHQSGTSYLGNAQKMALNHRNRSPAPTDCSQAGCHRPLGNTGSTYRNWN